MLKRIFNFREPSKADWVEAARNVEKISKPVPGFVWHFLSRSKDLPVLISKQSFEIFIHTKKFEDQKFNYQTSLSELNPRISF